MSDLQRRFAREIAEALRVGVSKADVALVVDRMVGEPELAEVDVLRTALMQYAPTGAFLTHGPPGDVLVTVDRGRRERAATIEAMCADGWSIVEIAGSVGMPVESLKREIRWMRTEGYLVLERTTMPAPTPA